MIKTRFISFALGMLAAALALTGMVRAQALLPGGPAIASPAPISVAGLPGTEWELKIRRTDKTPRFPPEAILLRFLPNGHVLVGHGAAIYMPAWAAKGDVIALQGEGVRATLKFANGPTQGSGSINLGGFEITGLAYKGKFDLTTPFALSVLKNDTCAFVARAMHTSLEGFWELPSNAAYYQLRGQGNSNRYDEVLGASIKGKSKNLKGVKAEYERRVADLSGCVITLHERTYGLEMLHETDQQSEDSFSVDTIMRLRNAPDYLSDLRVHIIGSWFLSPWIMVNTGMNQTVYGRASIEMVNAEQRLIRHRELKWTPVSTAPDLPDPFEDISTDALMNAGDTIWGLARGDTRELANWGARSIGYYHAACERGAMLACGRKGLIMAKNHVGLGNIGRVKPLFEKGCTTGDREICFALAEYLRKTSVVSVVETRDNILRAIAMFESLCEKNHGPACLKMGVELGGFGKFLDRDWPRAQKFNVKACELGEAFACQTAASIFFTGEEGVAVDMVRARAMFTISCITGNSLNSTSCRLAGKMALHGQGGAASEQEAIRMFRQGCSFRDAESCKALNLPVPQ